MRGEDAREYNRRMKEKLVRALQKLYDNNRTDVKCSREESFYRSGICDAVSYIIVALELDVETKVEGGAE